MNADIRFGTDVTLAVSGYHSRDDRDEVDVSFRTISQAPVDIDLSQKVDGEFIRVPNPLVAYENPLWRQASRENDRNPGSDLGQRQPEMGSLTLDVLGRSFELRPPRFTIREWIPKGTPLSVNRDNPSDGEITYDRRQQDSFNAEAQVSLRRDFLGGGLNARTTFRGILERDSDEEQTAQGLDFFVSGVPSINAAGTTTATSSEEEIRA